MAPWVDVRRGDADGPKRRKIRSRTGFLLAQGRDSSQHRVDAQADDVLFKKVCHRFHYLSEFAKDPPEKREWYRRHFFNVVSEIVFGVLAIKQPNVPLAIQPETGEQLLNEYDDCMAARRPYEVP